MRSLHLHEPPERCQSACAVRHGAGHAGGRTHQSGPCSKSTLCTVVTKRNLCAFLPIRFALRRSILFAFRSGPPRSTAEHDPDVAVGELHQGWAFAQRESVVARTRARAGARERARAREQARVRARAQRTRARTRASASGSTRGNTSASASAVGGRRVRRLKRRTCTQRQRTSAASGARTRTRTRTFESDADVERGR